MGELHAIGGDIPAAIEAVSVPSYVIDTHGVIRWINPAAERLVGDVRGRQFTSVVAAEETRRAREHFASKLVAPERVTDAEVVVVGVDGDRVSVDISSVCLMDGHRFVGIFGQVADVVPEREQLLEEPPCLVAAPEERQVVGEP